VMMPFVICDHGPVEAKIVPADCLATPGRCRPGVYETVLLNGAKLIDWVQHWDRFDRNCRLTGLNGDRIRFRQMIEQQVHHIFTISRLRLMAYYEPIALQDTKPITYLAAAWPAAGACTKLNFKCILANSKRTAGDVSYNLKKLGQKSIDIELEFARENGFDDVLFLNEREELCEASYSNIWVVSGKTLITPPIDSPCLPGITREKVIQLATDLQLNVQTRPLTMKTLFAANEVFLTSSIRGIQPVTEIDGLTFLPRLTLKLVEIFNSTRV